VFAHSAGGIVACRVEDQPNLRRVVCFGYPFKHPQHGEEPFRTSHLQHMRKPVLMIQGLRDEYGNAQQAQRSYKLSDSICLVDIDADHNCDDLSAGEYQRTLKQVVEFFKESGSDPDCFCQSRLGRLCRFCMELFMCPLIGVGLCLKELP